MLVLYNNETQNRSINQSANRMFIQSGLRAKASIIVVKCIDDSSDALSNLALAL